MLVRYNRTNDLVLSGPGKEMGLAGVATGTRPERVPE